MISFHREIDMTLNRLEMHHTKKPQQHNKGKLSVLAVALSGALAAMAPAHAQTTILPGTYTSTQIWNSNDLFVDTGAIIATTGNGVAASGALGTLTNNGSIDGGPLNGVTITSGSTIDAMINNGALSGSVAGINNAGSITVLTNNIGSTVVGATGIINSGAVGTLSNSGAITGSGQYGGINNSGSIDTLINNSGGLISGSGQYGGILNTGSISTLTNNSGGAIGGGSNGIVNTNGGTITALTNGGRITGSSAIYNNTGGSIGALTNTGTISGVNAIYNDAQSSIGPITNSGVIAGRILNYSGNDLSISGGTGTTFGTLTGFGGGIGAGNIGTITNTASNLIFASGNQLLNDTINVGGSNTVINSAATLQVNNTIAITGNYTQIAAATLNIGVADNAQANGVVSTDSGYGRLVVSGNATFDAGSSVALTKLNSYVFAQGQRFVVVQTTTANANYNVGSLNYSATGYSGSITGASVTDTDNTAMTDLMITLASAGSGSGASTPVNMATTSNASASLGGLFNYTGTNADMLNLFNAAAAVGSSGEANRAGAQLSPAATGTALVQSSQAATQAVSDVTSAHIDAIRVAQASGSGNSGIATGEQMGDVGVWGQAFGGQANQADQAGASGYRAGYNGMLIGADTAISDQWRAGGLISYANTSIANTGDNTGSSGHVSAYGFTGYAGYAGEKWYLNLLAGAAAQKYNTLRAVNFSGFSGGASGQFDGMQYITSAQAGYPIKLDAATTLTPIGGLTYSRLHLDGYTETGSAAALQIGSASMSSIKSDLGAKLERMYKTSYGDMTPSAQLSWRHEYRNTGLQSVGSFAADTTGSTSFTAQGVAPEKDTGVLVLGMTLARSQNLTLAAHYTLEAASGYNAQTADVRLRYQF
jgi:outer membrane autotransporter protein